MQQACKASYEFGFLSQENTYDTYPPLGVVLMLLRMTCCIAVNLCKVSRSVVERGFKGRI